MRGNIIKYICMQNVPMHENRLQASSSSIPRILIWSIVIKPKELWPITTDADNPMNQLELEINVAGTKRGKMR